MGKTKIKKCVICGAVDSEKKTVRSYRWMAVMDKYDCRHDLQVKADLCNYHNTQLVLFLHAHLKPV